MQLLTVDQVSEMLNISVSTLAHWRANDKGPAYIRIAGHSRSGVRYKLEDLKRYVDEQQVIPGEQNNDKV